MRHNPVSAAIRVRPQVPRPEHLQSIDLQKASDQRGFNTPEPWLQKRLLAELRKVPGRIVTYDELEDAAYFDHPEGGPLHPRRSIVITLDRLRRNGMQIVTYWGRGRALEA